MERQLERFCEAVPGSTMESRSTGWLGIIARRGFAPAATRSVPLPKNLQEIAARHALEVLSGDGVIEVRRMGIHKGLAIDAADRIAGLRDRRNR